MMTDEKEYPVTLQVPIGPQLHNWLAVAAAQRGMTRQEYNRLALIHSLDCKHFQKLLDRSFGMERVE